MAYLGLNVSSCIMSFSWSQIILLSMNSITAVHLIASKGPPMTAYCWYRQSLLIFITGGSCSTFVMIESQHYDLVVDHYDLMLLHFLDTGQASHWVSHVHMTSSNPGFSNFWLNALLDFLSIPVGDIWWWWTLPWPWYFISVLWWHVECWQRSWGKWRRGRGATSTAQTRLQAPWVHKLLRSNISRISRGISFSVLQMAISIVHLGFLLFCSAHL